MSSVASAERFGRLVLTLVAVAWLLVFVLIAASRASHPFELEWLEGAMADHVMRILRGEPLYIPPAPEFVPFIYPPLFSYVSAGMALLVGPGLLPLRLVATLSTIGCFALVGAFVHRETKNRLAALTAAAFFAATYLHAGEWFDLARVDSLFLLFVLAAAYLVRFGRDTTSALAAGVALWLALMTKQSAVLIGGALVVLLLLQNRRRGIALLAAFAVPAVASQLLLHALTDGWYTWYVWEAPSSHGYIWQVLYAFWAWDLLRALPIATLAALWFLLSSRYRGNPASIFHATFAAALLLSSWLHRLHVGGYVNVLQLAFVAVSLLAGIAIARLLDEGIEPRVRLLALSACVMQLLLLSFDPRDVLPDERRTAAWNTVIEQIRRMSGEVWLPAHGYIPELAGKRSMVHLEAIFAVEATGDAEVAGNFRSEMERALADGRISAIITDANFEGACRGGGCGWLYDAVVRSYALSDTITADRAALVTRTGARVSPEHVYRWTGGGDGAARR